MISKVFNVTDSIVRKEELQPVEANALSQTRTPIPTLSNSECLNIEALLTLLARDKIHSRQLAGLK